MRYTEEDLIKIHENINVKDVISQYIELNENGKFYTGLCPFHKETTPSLIVDPEQNIWYCLGCGEGGDAVHFIMEHEECTANDAVKILSDAYDLGIVPKEEPENEVKYNEELTMLSFINMYAQQYFKQSLFTDEGAVAREYLEKRCMSDETIEKWGLGYADSSKDGLYQYLKRKGFRDDILKKSGLISFKEKGTYDKFFKRVMFPIKDLNGRIIAFGGRILDSGDCKYLNSPETMLFSKSNNLFGLNFAKETDKGYFILCEGYMDVISMHQAGFTNAIASLGTAFTREQCRIIKNYVKEVILTYDSDGPGIHAAERAIPMLKEAGISTRIINMLPAKDPDEFIKTFGKEAFQDRIDKATPSLEWELNVKKSKFDLSDPEQNNSYIKEVTDLLMARI